MCRYVGTFSTECNVCQLNHNLEYRLTEELQKRFLHYCAKFLCYEIHGNNDHILNSTTGEKKRLDWY